MSDEIKPLLQDASTDDDLRRLLDAASDHEPSPPDLARLGARLAGVLPPGALPPAATPTSPPPAGGASVVGGSAVGKAGAALLVLAVGGGGAWLAASSGSRETHPMTRAAPLASSATSEAALPPSASASVVEEAPPPAATSVQAPVRPKPAPTASAPPEATLLARAHAELLRGSAADALATTNEHAKAYAHGAFAQEREVIAIEALVALGRRDEARRRAAAFGVDYPGSSHAARISRILEAP